MRKKVIFTLQMAKFLTDKGFAAIGSAPNKNDLKKNVWFFKRTPELEVACAQYVEACRAAKSNTAPVSDSLLLKMNTEKGLSIGDIAKITGKTEVQVQKAIDNEIDRYKLFAIGAMNSSEIKELMAAQTTDERNRLIMKRMKRGGYTVYGEKNIYDFPTENESGEVSGNE